MRVVIALCLGLVSLPLYAQCPGGICPGTFRARRTVPVAIPRVSVVPTLVSSSPMVTSINGVPLATPISEAQFLSNVSSVSVSSVPAAIPKRPGHWSYPGNLATHLSTTHGVNVAGMSKEEMLDMHDYLHETSPRKSTSRRVGFFGRLFGR